MVCYLPGSSGRMVMRPIANRIYKSSTLFLTLVGGALFVH